MRISAVPPAQWNQRIHSSVLGREFAAVMATLGWRPFFAADDSDVALVLIRRLSVPGLRAWTTRARVYLNDGYPMFVRELQACLADEGVACATLGDPLCPLPSHLRNALRGAEIIDHHRIVHDLEADDETLLAGMDPKLRGHLRRAGRQGTTVSEIVSSDDLQAFCSLAAETADRIRHRNLVAALPDAFFAAVLRTMVPRGQALLLLARAGDRPLAGGLFFRTGPYLTYFHGVSTREPELARFQGPSAMFWHAMRHARSEGLRYFDHGAVTVTDDPNHPHFSVYDYKRKFGGRVEPVASAQLILSHTKHAFQERVMMPVWRRLHPFYMRLARGARAA